MRQLDLTFPLSPLEPCPWCEEACRLLDDGPPSTRWYVECGMCGSHGPFQRSREAAWTHWNLVAHDFWAYRKLLT